VYASIAELASMCIKMNVTGRRRQS
jgi:hypothetical protein